MMTDSEMREKMVDIIRDLSIRLSASILTTGKIPEKLEVYEAECENALMSLFTEGMVKARLDELEKVMRHLRDRYNLSETTYPSVEFVGKRLASLKEHKENK